MARHHGPLLAAVWLAMILGALAAGARGDSEAYEWARLRHNPVVISDPAVVWRESSRFLSRPVELRGRVTGVLRSEVLVTVMFKLDAGETVHLLTRPEQELAAAGQGARVLARLAEAPADVLVFNLLALAAAPREQAAAQPSGDQASAVGAQHAAPLQAQGAKAVAPQPTFVLPSRLPSRGGPPVPSEERILAAYAQTIAYFNPRLSEDRRVTIARYIIDFSRRIGVDARLVMAVVAAESNFNESATSRTGAMGLGQLMPATARGMGVRNAYDMRENLWAAIRLVRGHLENMDGDIALALACYNAGAGAVRRYGGVPPYRETRGYIRKVTRIYLQLAPEMAQ